MKEQKNVWRFEGETLELEWVMDKLTHFSVLLKEDENEVVRIEMIKEFVESQNNMIEKNRNCRNCNNIMMREEWNKRCNECKDNSNHKY